MPKRICRSHRESGAEAEAVEDKRQSEGNRMRLRDAVIKLGAKSPLWVHWEVASSPLYTIFRQLLNWLVREELVIVPLSGALEGHRMRC
jgi:hypothetical protein